MYHLYQRTTPQYGSTLGTRNPESTDEKERMMRLEKAQYAILRFQKYKGPEISQIEAHNERTKEKYASNPDVDASRTHLNFHLVQPTGAYRDVSNVQIATAHCRTRKDSVRVVEALITASPEFFEGKKPPEVRAFFEEAMRFLEKYQDKETFISAVVHMDEKTPHMHLTFVPLTQDKRLSAKDIVGGKKKLTQWQDRFWKHMVRKYPDLERGESANKTGRDHIPPRVYKEAAHLNQEFDAIRKTATQITPFNVKAKTAELTKLLDQFAPKYETYLTECKKYDAAFKRLRTENARLAKEAKANQQESMKRRMEIAKELADYENLRRDVERYAPELLAQNRPDSRAVNLGRQ